jgi:LacI family transcriptional regulator
MMLKKPKQREPGDVAKNHPDREGRGEGRGAGRAAGGNVTIAEVARQAGVSPMTVSRVINDPESVAEPRRQAVLRAIEALRYSPNQAAKALAGRKPVHLVLFYDNPSAAYLSTFLLGSLETAQRQHAQLTVIQCPAGAEKKAMRELLRIGAQGVLLPPPLCDSGKLHKSIRAAGLAPVSVAGGARIRETPSVRIDDFAAAVAMTRHILELGHRRVGFITGNPDQMASAERTRGYRAALAEAGIPVEEALIAPGLFTYRSGLTACEALLDLPAPPTAVFASNDDMAAAAVAVAHRRHLEVPRDFTVCGFDDTDLARSIWPELTTIRQPISEMASAATALLIEHIRARQRGREMEPETHEFQFSLVRRDSDAAPR